MLFLSPPPPLGCVAPRTVKKYKVHGLPTFMVVKNGEVLNIQEGAMGKAKLYEYVHTHLPELK